MARYRQPEQLPPRKSTQDGLDACMCLLAAMHFAERKDCLMVGDRQTGYMVVVPHCARLRTELEGRCCKTGRRPSQLVRLFQRAIKVRKDKGNSEYFIEEIRQIRHKIEAECEGDAQKYYEHIQHVQENYRNRFVQRKPKPALNKQRVNFRSL